MDAAVQNVPINISRKVDVWSLACIFSEIAAWVGHGSRRVEQYRIERQEEVAKKLSNPEDGDLFHDGEKVLEAVENCHRSIDHSRRVDDFITPKVVKVIGDMMEDHKFRIDALQAHNKAEKAIRAATEDLKSFRNGIPGHSPTSDIRSNFTQSPEPPASPAEEGEAIVANGNASAPFISNQESASPFVSNDPPNATDLPPWLSVSSMQKWRASKKFGIPAELPDENLLRGIQGRDLVR